MTAHPFSAAIEECPDCGEQVIVALDTRDQEPGSTVLLGLEREPHGTGEWGFNIDACCEDHRPVARIMVGPLNLFREHTHT